ncbi:MAG: DUF2306 domain-containing protein [Hyphomonadaceae bacterium]
MSEAIAGRLAARKPVADSALGAAATLWFVVTLTGQWMFLYYLIAFYGPGALSGDLASWNRHPMIDHAFVAGDTVGNIAFAAHILFAVIIILGGMLQLVPQVRARAPALHRWNGRVFVVCSMLAALAGLYMVWIRGEEAGGADDFIISGNAVLILLFGALAWSAGMARKIEAHRRWALRMFMVTNGVFWLRLAFPAFVILTQSQPSSLTFYLLTALSYLLPLALLEIYLQAKRSSAAAKLIAAGVVFASSAFIVLGIFGFYMIFVRTILAA